MRHSTLDMRYDFRLFKSEGDLSKEASSMTQSCNGESEREPEGERARGEGKRLINMPRLHFN